MNSELKDDDGDVDIEDPFNSAMLLPQLEESPAEKGTHTNQKLEQNYFLASINSSILLRQLPSQGLSFQLWPAATTLVALLDTHLRQPSSAPGSPFSNLFRTRNNNRPLRILELGSGTGLVGIAAAALLGANVTVTDLPHVLPNLRFNADANAGIMRVNGGEVSAAVLSWGEVEHMEAIGKEYDLILGSDVVYHDHLYVPLIKTLKFFLLGNGGGEKKVDFVMAHLRRWKKESAFFKKARKLFDVQLVHTDPPPQGSRIGVVVYKFVGRGSS